MTEIDTGDTAFEEFACSLTGGHDIADLSNDLTANCVRLLDVASAALLLAGPAGALHVMAASGEAAREVNQAQVRIDEGPGLDCHRSGAPVLVPDLAAARARWPRFVPAALRAGFDCAHAFPVRPGDTVVGSLNLFGIGTGGLTAADLSLAQAFARVAGVVLFAGRAAADKAALAARLQEALEGRVVLEQAKGVLAQFGGVDMGQALTALRRYSHDHECKLTDIAAAVVSHGCLAGIVLAHARSKGVLAGPRPRLEVVRPGPETHRSRDPGWA